MITIAQVAAAPYYLLAMIDIDTDPLPNSAGSDPAGGLLSPILTIVFATLGSIALLMVVISGFRYILSSGDPSKMSQAKGGIIDSLVGLAVVLAAFSIVTMVARALQ